MSSFDVNEIDTERKSRFRDMDHTDRTGCETCSASCEVGLGGFQPYSSSGSSKPQELPGIELQTVRSRLYQNEILPSIATTS